MNKKTYVFVGGLPSHMMGVVSFTSFGQRAELTDAQASDLSRGGARIARAVDIDALGITAEEWRKYAAFGAHMKLPAEFAAKKTTALQSAEALCVEFEEIELARLAEAPEAAEGVEV